MSALHIFYREQAAKARAGASTATLDNVRTRWLLSEKTWIELADRSERAEIVRDRLIAQKASERAENRAAAQA
jgi:hypothetical protein